MPTINSFYTRAGDEGYTGLLGKGRIAKEDTRIEAVGSVDEAGASLGVARAVCQSPEISPIILQVQRDLYGLMAELAATPDNAKRFRTITEERVIWLESQVDTISAIVELPGEFIVPGDTIGGAFLDKARTVVRRAERRVSDLLHQGGIENTQLLRYLNRLSSLCYVLELRETQSAGSGSVTLAKVDK